ncbi:MAG: conjugal transfer protein TraX [Lachnospiraceae bacterium]|nr:conjugal transfer protein TraX [Lachnospiraceae bacterium]
MLNYTTAGNNSTMQMQKGLPGNFLKIFAALTMLIDHAALTLVYAKLAQSKEYLDIIFSAEPTAEQLAAIPADYLNLYSVYTIMRLVGRLAFPIFCFLLYEGFSHTSNLKRYLLRVGLCALVSEIPFNLVVSKLNTGTASLFYPQLQNTVCTLFLILLMFCGMKYFEAKEFTSKAAIRQMIGQILCVCAALAVSLFARVDYTYYGVLLGMIFYYCRTSRKMQIILGCIVFIGVNIASLLAFVPIAMYNGTLIISKKFKYFFYIFYPVHLLMLYLLSLLIR